MSANRARYPALDAHSLDTVFIQHLREGITKALSTVCSPAELSGYGPHISVAAAAAVYTLTWGLGKASPGQYAAHVTVPRDSSITGRARLAASVVLILFEAVGCDLLQRFCDSAATQSSSTTTTLAPAAPTVTPATAQVNASESGSDLRGNGDGVLHAYARVGVLIRVLASHGKMLCRLWKIAQLISFLDFLRTGKYATVTQRLLNFPDVVASPSANRDTVTPLPPAVSLIAMHFLTQQGSEFLEFMKTAVPWWRIWKSMMAMLRRMLRSIRTALPLTGTAASAEASTTTAAAAMTSECSWCGKKPPTCATVSECGHVYCYVCLRSGLQSSDGFDCATCGEPIRRADRLS